MRYSILIFVLFCGGCVGGDLATGADASLGTGGSAGGGGGFRAFANLAVDSALVFEALSSATATVNGRCRETV